jgi:hypothetical protein
VPFSVETVPEIDLDAGRLVIDPPGRAFGLTRGEEERTCTSTLSPTGKLTKRRGGENVPKHVVSDRD